MRGLHRSVQKTSLTLTLVAGALTALALASCGKEKVAPEKIPLGSTEDCRATGTCLDFKTVYERVLRPNCIECHNATKHPHGINLATYESVLSQALYPPLITKGKPGDSSLYLSVKDDDMPKHRPPLKPELKKLLSDWIEAGAPQTAHDHHHPGEPGDNPGGEPVDPPGDGNEPVDPPHNGISGQEPCDPVAEITSDEPGPIACKVGPH